MQAFEAYISEAIINNVRVIEAPRDTIDLMFGKNFTGLYFDYKGVRVFEKGKRAEAEAKDARTMDEVLHREF